MIIRNMSCSSKLAVIEMKYTNTANSDANTHFERLLVLICTDSILRQLIRTIDALVKITTSYIMTSICNRCTQYANE